MTLNITCECGKKLKASAQDAGTKGRCPDCGKVFTIPWPELDEASQAEMKQLCAEAAALRCEWKQPGNVEQAEVLFRQAIEKFGHCWAAHYGLANTLLFQFALNRQEPDYQKRAEALNALKRAINLDSVQREPLLELARRTAPIDIKEGRRLYQRAMRASDADQQPLFPMEWQAPHHFRFAIAAAEGGLNALAIDAFCRAFEIDGQFKTQAPNPPKARTCWNLALKKLGGGEPQ
jgi:tetratricopeptide (TPR) repeat protein